MRLRKTIGMAVMVGLLLAGLVSGAGAFDNPYEKTARKGAVNGYAGLGADGKVPSGQLPAGGSATFITLTDAPASYSGAGTKAVRVNSGATGLEFFTPTGSWVGLGSVENTALSTWAGTSNITTLGTIATGVWHGTAIGDTYISSATSWNLAYSWGNHASAGYAPLNSPSLVTPALGTPASGNLANCTFPTLNQSTSGTAANVSGTPALPNGTTATTQAAGDSSTKLATTAFAAAGFQPVPVVQPAVITAGVADAPVVGTVGATIIYNLTVNAAITSFPAPIGTPKDGQTIRMRLLDSGGAWAIAGWNGVYIVGTAVSLPTTTGASKLMEIALEWNAGKSAWLVLAVGPGF